MKRLPALAVFLPAVLLASAVTHTATFSESELRFTRSDAGDVVELARGHLVPDVGKPALPVVNVTLAVPADARVTGVTVAPLSSVELAGTYDIAPCEQPRPIGHQSPGSSPKSLSVYGSDAPYPAAPLQHHRPGRAAGFRLVSVALSPLQYRPLSKRLTLLTRLQVTVSYDRTAEAPVLTPTQLERSRASLVSLVTNPEDLGRFSPRAAESDLPEVTLLVVTADRLASGLQPFVQYKTSRGFRAEVRTTEWAERNYPGRDVQERLRNMIRDFYAYRGTSFVLLAGDNAEVPCRRIRLNVFDEEGDIPTDLYYGDLDFSWDSNHNNRFGEMDDSVDLYADVWVGRACVQNASEIQTLLDKARKYETDPATDYIKRALLPSGWLWRSIGYHGRFMNDSIANITPSGWLDRAMVNPAGAPVVADSFERGFSIFDPAGHGNSSGVYDESGTPIYTTGVAGSQHNDRRFSISTSLACDPGNFEWEDCLAEVSHNCPAGGSIAVMMNSRYGWGTPPYIGPSELLCIRFYDFMLSRQTANMAMCHDRSREEYASSAQYSDLWRWCMTEFNLFSDPTLDIWTEVPGRLSVEAPDTIRTGAETLVVTVRDGGTPVPGARVCAYMAPDVYVAGFTGSGGLVSLLVHPHAAGTLTLTASGYNRLPATESIAVVQGTPEPHVVFSRVSVNDEGSSNPNGILEPGETGRMTLVVRNSGSAAATGAQVVLRPGTGRIVLPDSSASLGTIAPSDTAVTTDLLVTALPDAYPGSSPEVVGTVTSGEGTWELAFSFSIGFPGRVSAEIDTGVCILTVTGRGLVGFDVEGTRTGRGFRFPETDTSCLNTASFCLATSQDYVVDRFYNRAEGLDRDWVLADSVRQAVPQWGSDEMLTSAFSDAGHPSARGITVRQRGLGLTDPALSGCVVLVYDVWNHGASALNGAYAGVIADFDVKATDRLHDFARTAPELATAWMRSVTVADRVCGVKLLAPAAPAHVGCIDHARYVYPDSGLSEDMKYRILTGGLGASQGDRPFNWSVSAGFGPFDIEPNGGRQRLAFAFIAAEDSVSYLAACQACQQWYDTHVGVADAVSPAGVRRLAVSPNPFGSELLIRCVAEPGTPVEVRAFDACGRLAADIFSGPVVAGRAIRWRPTGLGAGVYVIKAGTSRWTTSTRVLLVR